MLPRFFLEMDSFEFSNFRSNNNPGRSRTEPDWLMRLTIIRTLGTHLQENTTFGFEFTGPASESCPERSAYGMRCREVTKEPIALTPATVRPAHGAAIADVERDERAAPARERRQRSDSN